MRNMRNMLNVLIELDKFGMTNKELAEKLGVNRDTVSNWWGGTSPTRKNRFKLNRLLDELKAIVEAVPVPVQAVGGLTIEQAVKTPEYGAPLVVLGAPLTIDADAFKTASGNLEESLKLICDKVHGFGDVPVNGV